MTWYQYLFLSLAVVLFSLSQLHTFGKLLWQNKVETFGFFGRQSHLRKYSYDKFTETWDTNKERFFGSTTFLVWTTDFYHLAQMLMKASFSIGFFDFTWNALAAFTAWTFIQWGTFKIFSKS